ncbi:universal stress protein [Neptunicella marina]|uniref:Universal stress protein n=1 Tax=Neptunicella marina TaxID=2125989 RepID=A0A8J6M2W8_9ALTE|nr:universal stress protein [Neptunicella marina]MBC3766823.1 universal stress protein [Neptunicella marina]
MKINTILVIADKQDKQQKALARAQIMAERFDAKVHVVAFTYERLAGLSVDLSESDVQKAQQTLLKKHHDWLAKQVKEQELDASFEVVWEKDIVSWVKTHTAEQHYDLIIKTGNRSETALYTPTDWHLFRNGELPVLLVAEKRWRKKQAVMVALDMATKSKAKQTLNKKLVETAKVMAEGMQMPLHFVCSLSISPVLKDLGIVDSKKLVRKAKAEYLPQIRKMAGNDSLTEETVHIKAGEACKVIPSVASEYGASLVVIGSVGRKGLKAKLMGNTAEKVLALLKTNVLVVQP